MAITLAGTAAATLPPSELLEHLTLDQALELADRHHPQIAEAKALIEAAEGRARQAGAFPNPEAILGAQQLPVGNDAPREKEYVAGVGQTLPLSGRLAKARAAELLDREVRARGLEVARREIRRRVHSAFATALYQEKAWEAQGEIRRNTEQALAIATARLAAGDALPGDVARVEMELARAKVERQRAASLREQALLALASAIGDVGLPVRSLSGTLDAAFEIPALESLVATLPAQPESALAEAELRAGNARVELARTERIPDVKVELLYHRLEASQQNTLDVGLSLPLPLFNRNQGRLREARAEVVAAEARARLTRNERTARLRASYLQLTVALASSRAFRTEILAKADIVLQAAEARYAGGDISLNELIPVRRDWAAIQLSYLESLRDVMLAWGEITSLSDARPLVVSPTP